MSEEEQRPRLVMAGYGGTGINGLRPEKIRYFPARNFYHLCYPRKQCYNTLLSIFIYGHTIMLSADFVLTGVN